MKKKLIIVLSSVLTIAAIGGSFAWFTAKDSITNHFTTSNKSDGVKVEENKEWKDPDGDKIYENEEAKNITPGTEVNKDVWAKNISEYDSFIRARLVPKFTKLKFIKLEDADNSLLELTYANTTTTDKLEENKWVDGGDGYFYYLGKVPKEGTTEKLLDAVTLSGNASNDYKNSEFDVIVEAEGVQATNGAAASNWQTANKDVISKLTSLEG